MATIFSKGGKQFRLSLVHRKYRKRLHRYAYKLGEELTAIVNRDIKTGHIKVTARVEADDIVFYAPAHFLFLNDGVKGAVNQTKAPGSPFRMKEKMPPPSAFARYTQDKKGQFKLAAAVRRDGVKKHDFIADFLNNSRVDTALEAIIMVLIDDFLIVKFPKERYAFNVKVVY